MKKMFPTIFLVGVLTLLLSPLALTSGSLTKARAQQIISCEVVIEWYNQHVAHANELLSNISSISWATLTPEEIELLIGWTNELNEEQRVIDGLWPHVNACYPGQS